MSEFVRPFGPTIYQGKLTDEEIKYLKSVADVTFEARQNVGSDLAGNIEELLKQRPNDVRVAWYHFPMHTSCNSTGLKKDMHPRACAAAKASICAHEQGSFWSMHDTLFQNSAKLENKDLLRYAKQNDDPQITEVAEFGRTQT